MLKFFIIVQKFIFLPSKYSFFIEQSIRTLCKILSKTKLQSRYLKLVINRCTWVNEWQLLNADWITWSTLELIHTALKFWLKYKLWKGIWLNEYFFLFVLRTTFYWAVMQSLWVDISIEESPNIEIKVICSYISNFKFHVCKQAS